MSRRLLSLSLSLIIGMVPALQPAAQSIRLPDIGDPSQVYFGPDEEQKMGLEVMQWPVSYTHLDVYKRQGEYGWLRHRTKRSVA